MGICRNHGSRQAAEVAFCNYLLLHSILILLILTLLQPAVLFHVSGSVHLQMTMTGPKVWDNEISLSTIKTLRWTGSRAVSDKLVQRIFLRKIAVELDKTTSSAVVS